MAGDEIRVGEGTAAHRTLVHHRDSVGAALVHVARAAQQLAAIEKTGAILPPALAQDVDFIGIDLSKLVGALYVEFISSGGAAHLVCNADAS